MTGSAMISVVTVFEVPFPIRQSWGVRNSIGLVTALGYERSAAIAREALKTGGSVYDLVLVKGWLTKEKLDDFLKPENMTHPRMLS